MSGWPIAARIAGRRNTSNETYELTGLPGSVTIGTPRQPPGALRHARLHGDLGELDALPGERVLHHLVRAGRDAARGHDQVDGRRRVGRRRERRAQLVDVVGDEVLDLRRRRRSRPARRPASARSTRRSGRRPSGSPGPHELTPGGEHEHPQRPPHGQGRQARARRPRRSAVGPITVPAGSTTAPRRTSSPRVRTCTPGAGAPSMRTRSTPPSVRSTWHDRVRARRAPGHRS